MSTLAHPCLEVQTSAASQPALPPWFAETILLAEYLWVHGLLETMATQVRLVRGRFGQYEVLDFLALLFGYAISGERTLQAYFERLAPFAAPFMALFERGTQPHRATLSRFLAAVDDPCVDASRTLFASSSFTWGWTQATIGASGIAPVAALSSSILMARAKRPASGRCLMIRSCRLPSDASRPAVRLATKCDDAVR